MGAWQDRAGAWRPGLYSAANAVGRALVRPGPDGGSSRGARGWLRRGAECQGGHPTATRETTGHGGRNQAGAESIRNREAPDPHRT